MKDIKALIDDACDDEDGAGFTVRFWLVGGQVVEMNVWTVSEIDTYITGFRLTDDGYEQGKMVIRLDHISAAEIVW